MADLTSPGAMTAARIAAEQAVFAAVTPAFDAFADAARALPAGATFGEVFGVYVEQVGPTLANSLDPTDALLDARLAASPVPSIVQAGLTPDGDLDAALSEAAGVFNRQVRTEATTLFSSATLDDLLLAGYTDKRWVAHHDKATRPTHLAADGQTQPISASFVVGGYALAYPGDPNSPPAERYNCRCVMVGVVPEGKTRTQLSQWTDEQRALRGWGEATAASGDRMLGQMMSIQGYGRPTQVSADELAAMAGERIYRGVQNVRGHTASSMVDDFVTAETAWVGRGQFGNGWYFTGEYRTARSYAGMAKGTDQGEVLEAVISSTARVGDLDAVEDEWLVAVKRAQRSLSPEDFTEWSQVWGDVGRYATAVGYDALKRSNGHYIVLNRSALTVAKRSK